MACQPVSAKRFLPQKMKYRSRWQIRLILSGKPIDYDIKYIVLRMITKRVEMVWNSTNSICTLAMSVIRRNSTGEVVGTVRLILPRLDSPKKALPMLRVCDPAMFRHVPLSRAGEVSRFAISKARRGMEPHVIAVMRLGLMQACLRLSVEAGHTHFIGSWNPASCASWARRGSILQPAGPLVNYHGWRQPAYRDWDVRFDRMARERPEIWDFVTAGGRWWGNSGVDDAGTPGSVGRHSEWG